MIHQHAKFWAIPLMYSQENAYKPQILPVLRSQNATKMRKMNKPWPKPNQFWRWWGYISCQAIPPIPSAENACKTQFWHASLSQNATQIRKINRLWPKSSKFWKWWAYISMSSFGPSGHSSHAFSRKCPETAISTCFNLFSLSQNTAKMRKIRLWPQSDHFWRWLGYICMSNFRPFLQSVSQKMPWNHKFDLFH